MTCFSSSLQDFRSKTSENFQTRSEHISLIKMGITMCPFLPNPNLPQKIAETDVPRGYIRKINFDVNLPIQTWTPHA